MYLNIEAFIDLPVKAERTLTGEIWLRHPGGEFSLWMDDEDARELVKQLTALLDPAKPERPLDDDGNEIDPRGYVFIDRGGSAWGFTDDDYRAGFAQVAKYADRPFRTMVEAGTAGKRCIWGCIRVEVWTPECGVPPMPEKTS